MQLLALFFYYRVVVLFTVGLEMHVKKWHQDWTERDSQQRLIMLVKRPKLLIVINIKEACIDCSSLLKPICFVKCMHCTSLLVSLACYWECLWVDHMLLVCDGGGGGEVWGRSKEPLHMRLSNPAYIIILLLVTIR